MLGCIAVGLFVRTEDVVDRIATEGYVVIQPNMVGIVTRIVFSIVLRRDRHRDAASTSSELQRTSGPGGNGL